MTRIDDATLGVMVEHAREAHQNDVYYEIAPNAFLAIVTELDELRAKAQGGGWIAVVERMPPTGMTVIVEGGTAQFDGIVWRSVSANLRPIEWTVTHWQHLPRLEAS